MHREMSSASPGATHRKPTRRAGRKAPTLRTDSNTSGTAGGRVVIHPKRGWVGPDSMYNCVRTKWKAPYIKKKLEILKTCSRRAFGRFGTRQDSGVEEINQNEVKCDNSAILGYTPHPHT